MKNAGLKIYTKTGDLGQTRLLGGESVEKDHARVATYGTLDELQSQLGLARAAVRHKPVEKVLFHIQQDLFTAGSELASTHGSLSRLNRRIGKRDVERLERTIDEWTARYGLPHRFVIPGGSMESAFLHVARSVCRRCERSIVVLNRETADYPELVVYFNRLSDLLFVLAWSLELRALVEDVVRDLIGRDSSGGECS